MQDFAFVDAESLKVPVGPFPFHLNDVHVLILLIVPAQHGVICKPDAFSKSLIQMLNRTGLSSSSLFTGFHVEYNLLITSLKKVNHGVHAAVAKLGQMNTIGTVFLTKS